MSADAERVRPTRHNVDFEVGIGHTRAEVQPLGIAANASANGLFVKTAHPPETGQVVRVWVFDGNDVQDFETRVVRHNDEGVGLTFDDWRFSRWVAEHRPSLL